MLPRETYRTRLQSLRQSIFGSLDSLGHWDPKHQMHHLGTDGNINTRIAFPGIFFDVLPGNKMVDSDWCLGNYKRDPTIAS